MASNPILFEYFFWIEEQEDGYLIEWSSEYFGEVSEESSVDDWEDFWKDANKDELEDSI